MLTGPKYEAPACSKFKPRHMASMPCQERARHSTLALQDVVALLAFNVVNVAIWWVVGQLMDGVNLSFFSPLLSGTR